MKTSLSSLELYYLIKELQFLVNSRVDKIYIPSKKEIIIQLHVSGKGNYNIKIDEKSAYLTENKPIPKEPSGFCMFLRKRLENSKLRKISQICFERILQLDFETKEGTLSLICEIFSKGNIILTKNNEILAVAEQQTWAARTVKSKEKYIPPTREYNFTELKKSQLKELLSKSEKESLVKSLAMDLGLGGVYSEELLSFTKIDKNKKPREIEEKEILALSEAIEKILSKKLSPMIVYKDNEILDITPFELNYYKDLKKESSETYSKALDSYFSKFTVVAEKVKLQKELEKATEIIKQQEKQIKQFEQEEQENKQKAELLYQNYQLVSDILKELKEISKKHNWSEIKEKLKNHKIIKEVIPAEKAIVVEL
jgi:predicted ribosome quality control (RQC) complex YloA/Tae2 family protein